MAGRKFTPIAPGDVFGRLTVIQFDSKSRRWENIWLCRCTCGTEKAIAQDSLRSGNTQSCGCLHRERTSAAKMRHGHSVGGVMSRTYRSYMEMHDRCENPRKSQFPLYGARGITVCPEWGTFDRFLADMGERPLGMSLDRRNNDLGYSQSNCRWATRTEQMRNTRYSRTLTFDGQTLTLAGWAERAGLDYHCFYSRLDAGWPIGRILTTPSRRRPRT